MISGGSDNIVNIINPTDFSLVVTVKLEACPKSIDFSKYLLVGMKNGSIAEYDVKKD